MKLDKLKGKTLRAMVRRVLAHAADLEKHGNLLGALDIRNALTITVDSQQPLGIPERFDRGDILREALRLTTGDRNDSYGDPLTNHQRIAAIWSVVLGITVTPAQACLCMAGLKLARLAFDPGNVDSNVDLAAYAAIAAELYERENR